jgi:hypothetical protein
MQVTSFGLKPFKDNWTTEEDHLVCNMKRKGSSWDEISK